MRGLALAAPHRASHSHAPPAVKPRAEEASSGAAARAPAFDPAKLEKKLDAALESLHRELGKLRAGRAGAGMLDHLVVPSLVGGGAAVALRELATVTVRDASTLCLHLYDADQAPAVEKAVRASPLGLSPRVEGGQVTVHVSPPSAQQRAQLAKLAAAAGEAARASGRRVRADALEELRRAKGGSADDSKRQEKALQAATDAFAKAVAAAVTAKEKEML